MAVASNDLQCLGSFVDVLQSTRSLTFYQKYRKQQLFQALYGVAGKYIKVKVKSELGTELSQRRVSIPSGFSLSHITNNANGPTYSGTHREVEMSTPYELGTLTGSAPGGGPNIDERQLLDWTHVSGRRDFATSSTQNNGRNPAMDPAGIVLEIWFYNNHQSGSF
ncbi:hypothetical protein EYZ11_004473 [Aspergillus tanneri]|uniref:Uncharacterized protein n=1 Tax=Aspergillus tanneri TaxID=1220188 RepID=A0A4S3JKS9_9EURO|nr:hypothetical protein EYZ11_004473 [Aspergillus tanneri]